jgi:hypothetical protein
MEKDKKKKKKVKVVHKLIPEVVDLKVIRMYDHVSYICYNDYALIFKHYVKAERAYKFIYDPYSDLIKNQHVKKLVFRSGDFNDFHNFIVYRSVNGKDTYYLFNKETQRIIHTNIPFKKIQYAKFYCNYSIDNMGENDMIIQSRSRLIRLSDLAIIDCETDFVWVHNMQYVVTCSYLPEIFHDEKVNINFERPTKTIKLAQPYEEERFKVYFSIYDLPTFEHITSGESVIENIYITGRKITYEMLCAQRNYVRDNITFPRITGIEISVFSSQFRLYGIKIGECCVCFERDEKVKLKPCGHSKFCMGCVEKIRKCPLCRADIINKEIVYVHV